MLYCGWCLCTGAHCLSLEEVELSLVRSHLGQQFPLLVQLLLPLRAGRRYTAEREGGGGGGGRGVVVACSQ